MNKKTISISLATLLISTFSMAMAPSSYSAPATRDTSKVISREMKVDQFDAVDVSGGLRVSLKLGASPKVLVECNEKSMNQVKVNVTKNILSISTPTKFTASHAQVTIIVPTLSRINASGFVEAKLEQMKGSNLHIESHNNCTVESTGMVEKLNVTADGQSLLKLENLKSNDCVASVSGKTFAKVFAANTLKASAQGESVLNVRGNPKILSKNIASTSFFKMLK